MKKAKNLLRDNIKDLIPYSSARDEYDKTEGLFLDANENSFGSIIDSGLNRYPDPQQKILKSKLSKIKKINSENIFVGNGSDEAIDLLLRLFCEPKKDNVIIMPPTYGMYEVAAKINDVKVLTAPLKMNFELDLKKIRTIINDKSKIMFICSPNNPTGNCFNKNEIESLITSFAGIVVIDEAYMDFSARESWVNKIKDYDNLVVLQTFSKAWGLANIRVGTAYADPYTISEMNKIKYPYNVSGLSQQIVTDALDKIETKEIITKNIIDEREKMVIELNKVTFIEKVFSSEANFLLIKTKNADETYDFLLKHNIIVRNRSNQLNCEECLRITIGTAGQNKLLLNKFYLLEKEYEAGVIY